MLYRLDRNTQAGMIPVTDLIGPVLIRRYATALSLARQEAAKDPDGCVHITRVHPHLKQVAIVYPDGKVTR